LFVYGGSVYYISMERAVIGLNSQKINFKGTTAMPQSGKSRKDVKVINPLNFLKGGLP